MCLSLLPTVSGLDGELISFAASHTGANLRATEIQVNYTCLKPVAFLECSLLTISSDALQESK